MLEPGLTRRALEPGQTGLEELEAAWTPEQLEAARRLEEPAARTLEEPVTGTWAPGEPATGTWGLGPEARLQRAGTQKMGLGAWLQGAGAWRCP